MEENVLRKLQLEELEILRVVRNICDTFNITYFLNSGTLLGAVRHGGFIPWDDDIDICMPYTDYLKFINVAKSALPKEYFLQNSDTDHNFQRAFTKVRRNNTTYLEKGLYSYDIHQGIWIDIFPLVPIRNQLVFRIKRIIASISNYCQSENYIASYKEEFVKTIGYPGLIMLKVFYFLPEKFRIQMHRMLLKLICSGKENKVSVLWAGLTKVYPTRIFENYDYLYFEGEEFKVPIGWDEYLRITYDDYMKLPPIEKRVNHNPCTIDFTHGAIKYN